MRKVSLVKLITLFLVVLTITTFSVQCKKEDSNAVIAGLDRSYKGTADSTKYTAFYTTNMFAFANPTPTMNDSITFRGVQAVITDNCATSSCHGGAISPKLNTYSEIMQYVNAGNPANSKLWTSMTTNDFNKAMPPVSSNTEVPVADKAIVYNWILNGAKEKPDANDFRPAAVAIISSGCTSGNCHNEATSTGVWARKGLIPGLATADTAVWSTTNLTTGAISTYLQLNNAAIRNTILQAYKDSVRKFYSDTLANASFRPYKTFSTPVAAASVRGPLNNYDDIIFDINYPKSVRSNTTVAYTDPTTKKAYYVKGDYLNGTSAIVLRVDSTILMANPRTGVWGTTNTGGMANQDGGLKASEIALIKAWYFSDPNIPDVWKYGVGNAGIFKYKVTGKVITK